MKPSGSSLNWLTLSQTRRQMFPTNYMRVCTDNVPKNNSCNSERRSRLRIIAHVGIGSSMSRATIFIKEGWLPSRPGKHDGRETTIPCWLGQVFTNCWHRISRQVKQEPHAKRPDFQSTLRIPIIPQAKTHFPRVVVDREANSSGYNGSANDTISFAAR